MLNGVCSEGCITKAPNDALRSVMASQSASKAADWSAASAVDLGSYFTLGVKSPDMAASSPVPLSACTPVATPRPPSSRIRVSNQCMSHMHSYLSVSFLLILSLSLSLSTVLFLHAHCVLCWGPKAFGDFWIGISITCTPFLMPCVKYCVLLMVHVGRDSCINCSDVCFLNG